MSEVMHGCVNTGRFGSRVGRSVILVMLKSCPGLHAQSLLDTSQGVSCCLCLRRIEKRVRARQLSQGPLLGDSLMGRILSLGRFIFYLGRGQTPGVLGIGILPHHPLWTELEALRPHMVEILRPLVDGT